MSNSQRIKGRAFEQSVARWYRALGLAARRGWQSREGDDDPDVIAGPLAIECKRRGTGLKLLYDAMEQTERASRGRVPIVHVKADWHPELVVVRLEDWASIIGPYLAGKVPGVAQVGRSTGQATPQPPESAMGDYTDD